MSLNIGIIGLAQSGKSTIFDALTKGKGVSGTAGTRMGIAKVPDHRLEVLADMFHPRKVVYAETSYVDIGASVRDLAKDKKGSQFLAQLVNVDALINVVRLFKNDSVPNLEGSQDVDKDLAAIDLELTFSDLGIIERRLQKLEGSLKSAKAPERAGFLREQELLLRLKTELEKEIPIWQLKLSPEDTRVIANYQFLTAKPMLVVINLSEDQLAQSAALEAEVNLHNRNPQRRIITLCGQLESELAQLDEAAAASFREEYGLKESGLNRTIRLSYELLGLISFLTAGEDECRAWPIKKGLEAQKAAGKIHSDIEKGFIRAEVISYEDLIQCGSLAEGKKRGILRLEGKTYIVQDGDIINFLFNV